ncbi:MAG TPA: PspC domain-containing protein [Bacteroidales bacterium]|jgi:phage shock protein C|nr:PspC domain-containing protein [Bacteroidales bacterium]HPE41073.1 PspC domain-containing protein [Bacteroidales bacterium]
MTYKKFIRSNTNRRIAGVCGGLADYFNIDPTLVRVLFVVFTLAGGSGILIYIATWILTPEN